MKKIILLIIASFFTSCNLKEKNNKVVNAPPAEEKQQSSISCYEYATSNDTIALRIMNDNGTITGALVYKLKEKDKNEGTLQGRMMNNILIADYNFMSEGLLSTRQIAFKLENKTFVEGYGEIVNRNDKTFFKNVDSLNFNTSMKLVEMPCL
ncbi:MAG: hypothetical protein ABI761_12475 [Saprospiraceae bacterium]